MSKNPPQLPSQIYKLLTAEQEEDMRKKKLQQDKQLQANKEAASRVLASIQQQLDSQVVSITRASKSYK